MLVWSSYSWLLWRVLWVSAVFAVTCDVRCESVLCLLWLLWRALWLSAVFDVTVVTCAVTQYCVCCDCCDVRCDSVLCLLWLLWRALWLSAVFAVYRVTVLVVEVTVEWHGRASSWTLARPACCLHWTPLSKRCTQETTSPSTSLAAAIDRQRRAVCQAW